MTWPRSFRENVWIYLIVNLICENEPVPAQAGKLPPPPPLRTLKFRFSSTRLDFFSLSLSPIRSSFSSPRRRHQSLYCACSSCSSVGDRRQHPDKIMAISTYSCVDIKHKRPSISKDQRPFLPIIDTHDVALNKTLLCRCGFISGKRVLCHARWVWTFFGKEKGDFPKSVRISVR